LGNELLLRFRAELEQMLGGNNTSWHEACVVACKLWVVVSTKLQGTANTPHCQNTTIRINNNKHNNNNNNNNNNNHTTWNWREQVSGRGVSANPVIPEW
jgi:hypothetical protein